VAPLTSGARPEFHAARTVDLAILNNVGLERDGGSDNRKTDDIARLAGSPGTIGRVRTRPVLSMPRHGWSFYDKADGG